MDVQPDRMTLHGFPTMARAILDEVLGCLPAYIKHHPLHVVRDPLGRAYNRTDHLPERRKMIQEWASYLDLDRLKANVGSSEQPCYTFH